MLYEAGEEGTERLYHATSDLGGGLYQGARKMAGACLTRMSIGTVVWIEVGHTALAVLQSVRSPASLVGI
jgi:hypothetical protein